MQGVGFRPMIYHYALQKGLKGTVCNSADGLHFVFNSTENEAENIFRYVRKSAPPFARITAATMQETCPEAFSSFTIIESNQGKNKSVLLTPDYASCNQCKKEVSDQTNRRYRYPFTTCTVCGPRYSIINKLPYDRANTSMHSFPFCEDCLKEYNDISDRRFYAQTISCNVCGPQLKAYNAEKRVVAEGNENVLQLIRLQLQKGEILAVKGIGGYLLICDATNAAAIKVLRARKQRPSKPFAVMCSNVEQAEHYAFIHPEESKKMVSAVAPVTILKAKKSELALDEIAPRLESIGIMLSYAPLFDIILRDFSKPLVATSANLSGSPIVFRDEEAVDKLTVFAGYIITHNRSILIPQDDSVLRVAPKEKQQIIIRRSRGLAPNYFHSYNTVEEVLATGAMMKSSFAVSTNNNIYISQYLGRTDNYDAQQMFLHSLNHLQDVTGAHPKKIATDLHPQYFSNQLAWKLNEHTKMLPHHQAHFKAVLAENNLLKENNILGVIWDGAGLGDDKQIHGGEFYQYNNGVMFRYNHFEYFPCILEDKMAREPRISALAICKYLTGASHILKHKFTPTEFDFYNKLLQQEAVLQSSSVGRIFDAAASLLDLIDIQTYEGEAAMLLEQSAQQYIDANGYEDLASYFTDHIECNKMPTAELFTGIATDIQRKENRKHIAAKFHYSLVHSVRLVAKKAQCSALAFSGGVFQNALLVDLLMHHLGKEYKLFFHSQLSPNDECVSFGQLAMSNVFD